MLEVYGMVAKVVSEICDDFRVIMEVALINVNFNKDKNENSKPCIGEKNHD